MSGVPEELLKRLQEAHNGPNTDPGLGFLPKLTPETLKNPALLQRAPRQVSTSRGFSTGNATAAGGTVNLGALIQLGPYAVAGNGCNSIDSAATLANISALNLLSTGAAQSNVLNINNGTLTGTSAYTSIAKINLLGSLITADAIQAVSFSYIGSSGPPKSQNSDTAGHQTNFLNLKVNGQPVLNVQPNTVIPLAGLGTVTLDEEHPTNTGGNSSLLVTMIHIRVTTGGNAFGLPVGADIYVARAYSAYFANQPPIALTGGGLGPIAFLYVGGVLTGQVGPLTTAGAPCTGGSAHASTATVILPNILKAGAASQDGSTFFKNNIGYAGGQVDVAQVNLLNGLLVVDALQSQAFANSTGSIYGHTIITGGKAGIIPLPANPAPNTTITVPLVATIILNEQIKIVGPGRYEIVVIPIDIQLLAPSPPLSAGARIFLGAAVAGTQAF